MPNIPNYNESQITGTSWQRAFRVVIDNPYQASPFLNFLEEKVYVIDDKVIKEPVTNMIVGFDPTDQLHVEIYARLNLLYEQVREKRDNPVNNTVIVEPPVVEPPADPPVVEEPPVVEPPLTDTPAP